MQTTQIILKKSQEIIRVLNELNIQFAKLSAQKTESLWIDLFKKYVENGEIYLYPEKDFPFPIWEVLKIEGFTDFQVTNAWKEYGKILDGQEVILFFEPLEELEMIYLSDGKDVSTILSEAYTMIPYITNPSLSFLFYYNDHDFLIVGGEGLDLIKKANVNFEILD